MNFIGGMLAPPIPDVAAQAGYNPYAWQRMRTVEQAAILRALFERQARARTGRSLGADMDPDPTTVNAGQLPRLADKAGQGLFQSDFRNDASDAAWWTKVDKRGNAPWEIQLVLANGSRVLRALQTMLAGAIPAPWKAVYPAGDTVNARLDVDGTFDERTCSALYLYAQQALPKMGMPVEQIGVMLQRIDDAAKNRTVTQNILILCVALTYYRPWLVHDGRTLTEHASILPAVNWTELQSLPTNKDLEVKMLQLPTDALPWVWAKHYAAPSGPVTGTPARLLSPWKLQADGTLKLGVGMQPIKPGELPPYIPSEVRLPYDPVRTGPPDSSGGSMGKVLLGLAAAGALVYYFSRSE